MTSNRTGTQRFRTRRSTSLFQFQESAVSHLQLCIFHKRIQCGARNTWPFVNERSPSLEKKKKGQCQRPKRGRQTDEHGRKLSSNHKFMQQERQSQKPSRAKRHKAERTGCVHRTKTSRSLSFSSCASCPKCHTEEKRTNEILTPRSSRI